MPVLKVFGSFYSSKQVALNKPPGRKWALKSMHSFFLTMVRAILLGDVLNALMYRIRPYELEPGRTDAVIHNAKQRLARAFETAVDLLKLSGKLVKKSLLFQWIICE